MRGKESAGETESEKQRKSEKEGEREKQSRRVVESALDLGPCPRTQTGAVAEDSSALVLFLSPRG